MDCRATRLSYFQTGYFSELVNDYLAGKNGLEKLYSFFPEKDNVLAAIQQRMRYNTDREKLADALELQYKSTDSSAKVKEHIQALKSSNSFTITTAHQPNLFTGPLYFIYKILHTIRLADICTRDFPQYKFIPVYYMGSEDADIEELGHIYLNGEKLSWDTAQTGAVGRMKVDEALQQMINRIEAELGVFEYGGEIVSLLKKYYTAGTTIQQATFGFVNELFADYGLVIVIPDSIALKAMAIPVFEDEILNHRSAKLVEDAVRLIKEKGYKPQAHARDINLFYLDGDQRNRIENTADNKWKVINTDISYTKEEILFDLNNHPDKFSPNVILRGLFQEMILPNIIFIGGGGELAYWMELKNIFSYYNVPYPILTLRNSFLFINRQYSSALHKNKIDVQDLFKPVHILQNKWIEKNGPNKIGVDESIDKIRQVYELLRHQAKAIDSTLLAHINALEQAAIKRIEILGKKMIKAEKKNYDVAMHQIERLKQTLFPHNNLQERIDNIAPYYAKHGMAFIKMLYENSLGFEQEFVILQES